MALTYNKWYTEVKVMQNLLVYLKDVQNAQSLNDSEIDKCMDYICTYVCITFSTYVYILYIW